MLWFCLKTLLVIFEINPKIFESQLRDSEYFYDELSKGYPFEEVR